MSPDLTTAEIAGSRPDDPPKRAGSNADQAGSSQRATSTLDATRSDRSTDAGESRSDDADTAPAERSSLVAADQSDRFQASWTEIQTHFVDAPQEAVQNADTLVAELMRHLAETFARERSALEQQWTRGEDVSTEELRVALTRYRSFFARLLEA
jgi:hypothetical protein